MDGIRLAHHVRDRWPPVKIIVVSGMIETQLSDLPHGSRLLAEALRSWRFGERHWTLDRSQLPARAEPEVRFARLDGALYRLAAIHRCNLGMDDGHLGSGLPVHELNAGV